MHTLLHVWYRENHRFLPWRETRDPYRIWLSEIILQQTRVAQGLPYYLKFIERFPSVLHFANAEPDEILKNWQGLGYYSRARNMIKCSKKIAQEYCGIFPTKYSDLILLPGIGSYTAAAIASFCTNEPIAVLDGNVFRVLSRYFGISNPINSPKSKLVFTELANEFLDQNNPGLHNQAIMELGALICKPANPDCSACPLSISCEARIKNLTSSLPVKLASGKKKKRFFNYFVPNNLDTLWLRKRKGKDIWTELYEPPLCETTSETELPPVPDFFKAIEKNNVPTLQFDSEVTHILSHQILHIKFWKIDASVLTLDPNSDIFEVGINEVKERYAVPVPVMNYLSKLLATNGVY
ncbi:MAG: A/G-specific adenine glycosylase [Bacteroidetes bacterium]|nr:A/G-specific adenine glycosylase [Bacteroidota bacterium]